MEGAEQKRLLWAIPPSWVFAALVASYPASIVKGGEDPWHRGPAFAQVCVLSVRR